MDGRLGLIPRRMTNTSPTVGALLKTLDGAPPYGLVEVLLADLTGTVSATACTVLLTEYEGRTLEPVPTGGHASASGSQSVDGSMAGQVYIDQRMQTDASGRRVLLPITARGERIGVLDVHLSVELDDHARTYLGQVGSVLGYVLLGARRYTDHFERIRRRRPLALAAEVQWELLPVLAFAAEEFSIAGSLEPAYEIGGDTFDYSVEPSALTVAITDARGHGLRAALLGSLAITSMRNSRRRGEGLVEQASAANAALLSQFDEEDFVTTVLLRIDVPSGAAALIIAGHPQPLVLRQGRCQRVAVEAQQPLGMFDVPPHSPSRITLEPGDRMVLFTDGITEAAPEGGRAFGPARLIELLSETSSQPPSEAVRMISDQVLTHRAGQLADDATIVILDWHGRRG